MNSMPFVLIFYSTFTMYLQLYLLKWKKESRVSESVGIGIGILSQKFFTSSSISLRPSHFRLRSLILSDDIIQRLYIVICINDGIMKLTRDHIFILVLIVATLIIIEVAPYLIPHWDFLLNTTYIIHLCIAN